MLISDYNLKEYKKLFITEKLESCTTFKLKRKKTFFKIK